MNNQVKVVSPNSVFNGKTGRIVDISEKLVYPVHVVFDKPIKLFGVTCKYSMFKKEELEAIDA